MKILIFGLGHLASYLLNEIKNTDYEVFGTYRSKNPLSKNGVKYIAGEPFPESLSLDFNYILWNFPPLENYLELLKSANQFFQIEIPWIFVSSTGVYGEGLIEESSPRVKTTSNSKILIECEDYLTSLKRNCVIVRPGGLVDSVRNPVHFFKNKNEIPASNTNVNMVHTQDVARFILFLMNNQITKESFNLVSSTHPTKKEFYSKIFLDNNRPLPVFNPINSYLRKVNNQKSKNIGFQYLYEDLLKLNWSC